MDNAEEVMQCLEEFSKMKPKDIPHELDDYLGYVAKTGDPVFKWSIIKYLFREKLVNVITDFYESTLSIEHPPCPNVDPFNYERMKANLLEKIDSFHGAPFTVQRISELLTNPRKEYNRADKFMRAIEKNILVVSTREPGRFSDGEQETDSSYNGMPEGKEPLVDTGFPCNDLPNSGTTPTQSFEIHPESMDTSYNVAVDSADSQSSVTPPMIDCPPHSDVFAVSQPRVECDGAINVPSTSTEVSSDSLTESQDSDSVICSTVDVYQDVLRQSIDPVGVEPAVSGAAGTSEMVSPLHQTGSIPSTSEAVPAEPPQETQTDSCPNSSTEDQLSQEDATSTQSPDESKPIEEPGVDSAGPQVIPTKEELASELLQSSEDSSIDVTEMDEEQESSEPLKSEAGVLEDGRDAECDSNFTPQEVEKEPPTHVKCPFDEPEAEIMIPEVPTEASTVGEPSVPAPVDDENTVTSCMVASDESLPTNNETIEEQPRETSVIHATSGDESMEVDECHTSSSEPTLQHEYVQVAESE